MGDVKDHVGMVEQNLQTLEDHVLEELESLKRAVGAQDELRERFTELFNSLQEQLDVVKVGVEEIRQDAAMCKRAIAGGAVVTPNSRVDMPKPKEFGGKRDAKELDNYIWHMEKYCDIEKGLYTIDTWEVFKKEIKKQFYPENVAYEARKKMKELRHKGSARDYVKGFASNVVWERLGCWRITKYPLPAALFGLDPLGYFLSRGVKKYHSLVPNSALSAFIVVMGWESSYGNIILVSINEGEEIKLCKLGRTRKLPRIMFVEINLSNDGNREGQVSSSLAAEVINHKFLVGRVEAESGGSSAYTGIIPSQPAEKAGISESLPDKEHKPSPVVLEESSPPVSPLLRRLQRDRHAIAYL
ncbi:hypothetical protein RJ639_042967 [Escallonia herrerae]|uniref:Retrotransposon gag domain-containing protein n=1 Tax=Escallonia herrerae TaxID=1293975 RepID=A0AA88WAI8_9ASTE|nr:hypothetical protein RJ639_042967 [Escallonia herrerae]